MISCRYTIVALIGHRIQINFIKINHTSPDPSYNKISFRIFEGADTKKEAVRSFWNGKEYPSTYLSTSPGPELILVVQKEEPSDVQLSLTFEYIIVAG